MLKVQVNNGRGTEIGAGVDPGGFIYVAPKSIPLHSQLDGNQWFIFRQYLTDDGTASGSNDLQVDGSSTNVDFYIPAQEINDLWITSVSFVMADTGGSLNEFVDTGAALTNGIRFFYERQTGQIDIHDALKTNFDFHRLAQIAPTFATGASPFRVTNAVSAAEAYIPTVDLRRVFGLQFGIRLSAGTKEKIVIRVRDDLTVAGITQLDAIAYGFEREPDG